MSMKHYSETEWLEKITQQKNSGKSASQWCRENGFSYQTFLSWRKRLCFLEIEKQSPFIELFENSSEPTWMEITIHGAKLVLAKKFNRETLIRLIEVLREM